jgi:cytosine/adenosine deaminase-related metal-dependent hydrolase
MGISATVSSGIRSIFGYTPTMRLKTWDPVSFDNDIMADWILNTFEEIAKAGPYGDGRVTIGFGFDFWFLPKEFIGAIFNRVKKAGAHLITSHYCRTAQLSLNSLPSLIDSYGLLDSQMLISHASGSTDEDMALFEKSGAKICSTPSTELQMVLGKPVSFQERSWELQNQLSLGIDCHTATSSSIPLEMRIGLQAERGARSDLFMQKDLAPKDTKPSTEYAYNLGTINGARAIGMEAQIGSIKVGKLADLVIFDGLSQTMICAAQHDPISAIVLHSAPADIDTVIVDGTIRKMDGKIMPMDVDTYASSKTGVDRLSWIKIAEALVASREKIQKKTQNIDYTKVQEATVSMLQLDLSKIVDTV